MLTHIAGQTVHLANNWSIYNYLEGPKTYTQDVYKLARGARALVVIQAVLTSRGLIRQFL